ncbi:hypothetical protein NQ176_g5036 [Zarea fungicola]|uniref:Uncharacterized protein n=1 Tax=Zarea fungicola TaxID=93591 RepID=A0ACC1NCT4_9HYPO|nr:hypothetical protein NQ176_g5036 [Lecanicillium fungicola]
MFRRHLLAQRPKILNRPTFNRPARLAPRRYQSTETTTTTQFDKITAKLPRRLQKYTKRLRNAPVSHIVSFLILHELTAIVPLFALFAVFHYTTYVPLTYVTTHFGSYVAAGVARFEKYFRRKGWFGFEKNDTVNDAQPEGGRADVTQDAVEKWQTGDPKYKILVEVSLAYAITKALLPLRVIGSVWATPWFAGVLLTLRKVVLRR